RRSDRTSRAARRGGPAHRRPPPPDRGWRTAPGLRGRGAEARGGAFRVRDDGDAIRGAVPLPRGKAPVMNVALTGASGYTGGHLLKRLVARGDSVKALVRAVSITPALKAS